VKDYKDLRVALELNRLTVTPQTLCHDLPDAGPLTSVASTTEHVVRPLLVRVLSEIVYFDVYFDSTLLLG
jgi:hypothetical protein